MPNFDMKDQEPRLALAIVEHAVDEEIKSLETALAANEARPYDQRDNYQRNADMRARLEAYKHVKSTINLAKIDFVITE